MHNLHPFIGVISTFSALMTGINSPAFSHTQSPSDPDITPLQQQLKSGNLKAA